MSVILHNSRRTQEFVSAAKLTELSRQQLILFTCLEWKQTFMGRYLENISINANPCDIMQIE